MTDGKFKLTRRALLASALGGTAGVAGALGGEENGTLSGGTMALNQAYNVSGKLWIGPDSAKSNVEAKTGRVYMASDAQVEYHGDNGSWVLMGVGSEQQPVPSINAQRASVTEASLSAGGTFVIFERGGVYYACDPNGDIQYKDEEPDLGALLQSISDDLNPSPGAESAGEYTVFDFVIEPKQSPYISKTTATFHNGSALSIHGHGARNVIIEWQGAQTDRVIDYQGTGTIQSASQYYYNVVTIRDIGIQWNEDRDADVINLHNVYTYKLENIWGHFTAFDLTDPVKSGETVPTVPSGDYFFIRDDAVFSNWRRIDGVQVAGAPRAIAMGGDHARMDSCIVMYANPPSGTGAIVADYDGGGNDNTITNTLIFESGSQGFSIHDSAEWVTLISNVVESAPPDGFNSQEAQIHIGTDAGPVFGLQNKLLRPSTRLSGDLGKYMEISGANIESKFLPGPEAVETDVAVTISAGGSVDISTGISDPREMLHEPIVRAASVPGADFQLDSDLWFDSSAGEWILTVSETKGITSVDIYWYIFSSNWSWW